MIRESLVWVVVLTVVVDVECSLSKIGHRGACGYAPENTISSFKKALELNVDMIEFDVYLCKSGELVVIHDAQVDRTTSGQGLVADKALDELQALTIDGYEHIPTLQEVLDCVDKKIMVNIELKAVGIAPFVAQIIEEYVYKKGWSYDHFLVSSYNHHELWELAQLNPKIKKGAILAGMPIDYASFAEKVGAHAAILYDECTNQAFVDDAHERGVQVFVYTVNDPDVIRMVKALGVDGIISDYPDRL